MYLYSWTKMMSAGAGRTARARLETIPGTVPTLRGEIAPGCRFAPRCPFVKSVCTEKDPVLKEVKRATLPVILVDRGIKASDESLFTTLISSDFVAEGRMAGEWLAKKLSGKGNIVELQGTTGAAPAIDRKKGFSEAIAKHPEMKITKSQSGDFTRAKGKEVLEAFLKA